jgi:hypothetical protein
VHEKRLTRKKYSRYLEDDRIADDKSYFNKMHGRAVNVSFVIRFILQLVITN